MSRQRGRCSKSRPEVIGPGRSVEEHDMVHIIMAYDGIHDMDGNRREAILTDIRDYLCQNMSDAELMLVDEIHPMKIDDDPENHQVEYYQQVETCP